MEQSTFSGIDCECLIQEHVGRGTSLTQFVERAHDHWLESAAPGYRGRIERRKYLFRMAQLTGVTPLQLMQLVVAHARVKRHNERIVSTEQASQSMLRSWPDILLESTV